MGQAEVKKVQMDRHRREELSARMNAILGEANGVWKHGEGSNQDMEMEYALPSVWPPDMECHRSSTRGGGFRYGNMYQGDPQNPYQEQREPGTSTGWNPFISGPFDALPPEIQNRSDGFVAQQSWQERSSMDPHIMGWQGKQMDKDYGQIQDNPMLNWSNSVPNSNQQARHPPGFELHPRWSEVAGTRQFRFPLRESQMNTQKYQSDNWQTWKAQQKVQNAWQKPSEIQRQSPKTADGQENRHKSTTWKSEMLPSFDKQGTAPRPKSTIVVNKVNRNLYVHEVNSYVSSQSGSQVSTPSSGIICHNNDQQGAEQNDPEKKQARVYVGGIPETLSKDEIHDHFEQWGTVVEICFPMEKNSHTKRRGFCFVNFKDRAAAHLAVESSPLAIAGKPIQSITFALDKEEIVKQRIVQLLQKLLERGQLRCRIDQLGNAYRDEYGCPLDYKKFGHQKLISLLTGIPELRISGGMSDGGGMRYVELRSITNRKSTTKMELTPQTPSTWGSADMEHSSTDMNHSSTLESFSLCSSTFVYPQSPTPSGWFPQNIAKQNVWADTSSRTGADSTDERAVSHLLPTSLYEDLSWLPRQNSHF